MIYILLDDAPTNILTIKGETFKYLIKVRRHSIGDEIQFRSRDNLSLLYKYELLEIDSRSVSLKRISMQENVVESTKNLHIAWCIIDNKSIEKVLPSLSEIGVKKISFIQCERSQKSFKIDLKRFHRILEASMQQCGRSTYIEFDSYKNIREFLTKFPDTKIFDFTDKTLENSSNIERVLIGCEGGFSPEERELFKEENVFRLDTDMVLRSESAVMAVASKILL